MIPNRPVIASVALTLGCALLVGCSDDAEPLADPAPSSAAPTVSGEPSPSANDESKQPEPEPEETLPEAPDRLSLPTLMREEYDAGPIRRTRLVVDAGAYRRYEARYRSGKITVSGVLLVPSGKGPFPGIVLNHGYIDPAIYVAGQGLAREQDALARAGFVVFHTDYRGHAASDPVAPMDRETRLGYTRDTINAVLALKQERRVDPDRIAMLGRSMGGGVTYNALVTQPGLVKAAVVYAPVSSRFQDNLRQFTIPGRPEVAEAFFGEHGTPRESPEFYAGLSPRTYFDRITEPVLIHHGTSDDSCPIRWSRATQRLMRDAGVESRLLVYPGEEHAFVPQWDQSMRRTIAFLRRNL